MDIRNKNSKRFRLMDFIWTIENAFLAFPRLEIDVFSLGNNETFKNLSHLIKNLFNQLFFILAT